MNNFKLFCEETFNGKRMSQILENLIISKHELRKPPFKYIWHATDEDFKKILTAPSERTTRNFQATLGLESQKILASMQIGSHRYGIWLYRMTDLRGKYLLKVEYSHPRIMTLVDAVITGNPHILTMFNSENTLRRIFIELEDYQWYLDVEDINQSHLLNEIQSYAGDFKAVRQIRTLQTSNTLTTPNMLACMEEWGLSDVDIIHLKRNIGVAIDPKDISDKTLVDLL